MQKIRLLNPDKGWSAQAAAGEAMESAPPNAPFVALWINEKGTLCCNQSNASARDLAWFAAYLLKEAT